MDITPCFESFTWIIGAGRGFFLPLLISFSFLGHTEKSALNTNTISSWRAVRVDSNGWEGGAICDNLVTSNRAEIAVSL